MGLYCLFELSIGFCLLASLNKSSLSDPLSVPTQVIFQETRVFLNTGILQEVRLTIVQITSKNQGKVKSHLSHYL